MAPDPKALKSSYEGIWKYPTNRDVPFRMAEDWLDAKRKDDDIESLWRVHDKLYNLEAFIKSHPGGPQWLEMSRGTDITEAFEASHTVNVELVEMALAKYFVRDASHPRISPYTFKPDACVHAKFYDIKPYNKLSFQLRIFTGDEPLPDPDFGIGQLDATRDRAETIFQNPFVTLITFGQHPLHHLFPTVCHSKLPYLRETFENTVREFKLDDYLFKGIPQKELYLGCYKQLARMEIKKRRKLE